MNTYEIHTTNKVHRAFGANAEEAVTSLNLEDDEKVLSIYPERD